MAPSAPRFFDTSPNGGAVPSVGAGKYHSQSWDTLDLPRPISPARRHEPTRTPDPIEVIRWKEVYETLEIAIDQCMGVANAVHSISIKLRCQKNTPA